MPRFDYTFYVESKAMCLEVECVLDYEPEQGDGWNEPRTPASATLQSAKLGGINITKALDANQVKAIEHDAMVWRADDLADQVAQVAIDAYESRVAA